ncbi:MAG TPA: ABC transporter substrate-binding protein [Stellaceae bacterium]|jgi:4,5-dihydroxyphthalate decarboxylase|nr:ABC transporter substrate-binding protein [Stellaceae bacterium]
MSRLRLTLACWDYDRTRALSDGRVVPDGIDLTYLTLPVEETFFRMLRYREFDAAEMSLSSYCVSRAAEHPAFIAIPVFVSRCFRHGSIFVSTKSGIRNPADLAGKRIGVPEYQMTAAVWIRGILHDEYGVAPDNAEYFSGGEEETGRDEKIALNLPARFRVRPIAPDQTLSRMIAEGEIDALETAREPSTFLTRPDAVRRLFPDYVAAEHDYFRKTGIFPIMHVVVLRRELYEANRWVARSLYKAFVAAQRIVYDDLAISAALKTMLPWQLAAVDEARQLMGPDWWPYGLAPNRHVLDTFLRYHHEQGLSPLRLQPEELFAPETLESFKI